MGGASLDLVCYSLGVPVLLECFFGLWRPSCPAGLKLVDSALYFKATRTENQAFEK